MRYEKEVVIPKGVGKRLEKALNWKDGDALDDSFGEDDAYVETAVFDNGFEMDIKVCGAQYEGAGGSNSAWSEAVLFQDGCEVCCTDPDDSLYGEWELEHDDDVFVVNVKEGT